MQRFWILVCLIAGCLFINDSVYATNQPVINLSVNYDRVPIGRVIKLELNVKAQKNSIILWKLFDEVFENSEKITVLSTNSSQTNDGHFKHQIFFTSAKPVQLSISSLPLTIDNEKTLTPSIKVSFKADQLPLKLHEIKPVEEVGWLFILKAYLFNALLLILILLIIGLTYLYLKNWIKVNAPVKFKQKCLKKLAVLESAAVQETVSVADLISQVFDLLKEYLQVYTSISTPQVEADTENNYPPIFYKFVEDANQLKFLPQPAAKLLYTDFISEIREFITTYQPKTQDDR